MEHWRFDGEAESGEWSWMCVNDEDGIATRCSARSFPSLTECLQDAVTNGYAD